MSIGMVTQLEFLGRSVFLPAPEAITELHRLLDDHERELATARSVPIAKVTREVEIVVEAATRALQATNSLLVAELHAAGLRIEFLEAQLAVLAEANTTARPGLIRGALGSMTATLREARGTAVGTAVGMTVGSLAVASLLGSGAPPPAALSATQLLAACHAIDVGVSTLTGPGDQVEVEAGEELPASE